MICDRIEFGEEWLRSIDPFDKQFHYERYEHPLWMMHLVAHFVNPQVIVELGVRSGYSAWAMLKAVPGARYIGYDNYDPAYAAAYGEGLSEEFHNWAEKLIAPYGGAEIVVQDTQVEGFQPPVAGLYHVDANHEYQAERCDIERCLAAGTAQSVIMVHDMMAEPVQRAVRDAIGERGVHVCRLPDLKNGIGLIFCDGIPDWAARIGAG